LKPGIGGLDLSGSKAVRDITANLGIAGGNYKNVIQAAHAAGDIAGDVADSATRQAVQRIADPKTPAVFVLSWLYGVTTGSRGRCTGARDFCGTLKASPPWLRGSRSGGPILS
jgi:hypothetical protein